jgi:hypothetical protein
LGAVAGVDVTDLVAEQGGQFRLVLHLHQDAAGGGDGTAGKGVGVDVGGVDRPEGVGHVWPVGAGGQGLADPVQVGVQPLVADRAVVAGELLRRLLPIEADFLVFAEHHQVAAAGGRVESAGRE